MPKLSGEPPAAPVKRLSGAWTLGALALIYLTVYVGLIGGEPPFDPQDDAHLVVSSGYIGWAEALNPFLKFEKPVFQAEGMPYYDAVGMISRKAQVIVLKALHHFCGYQALGYYLFQAVTVCAVMLILAGTFFRLTGSVGATLLYGLFLVSIPAWVLNSLWIADFSEWVHLVNLLVIVYFVAVYTPSMKDGGRIGRYQIGFMLVCPWAAWMACQARPSGYWLVAALWIFHATGLFNRTGFKRYAGWTAYLTGLTLALVPWDLSGGVPVNAGRVLAMTVWNRVTRFDSEALPAFVDLSLVKPVSVARSFGLGLLWLVIFSLSYLCWRRVRLRSAAVKMALCVFVSVAAFYAAASNEPRYLSDAIIPLSFVFAVVISRTYAIISDKRKRLIYALAAVAITLVSTAVNGLHSIHWRNMQLSGNRMQIEAARGVVNDYFGRPPSAAMGLEEMHMMISTTNVDRTALWGELSFWNLTACSDRLEYGPRCADASLERVRRQFGKAYFLSFEGTRPPAGGFEEVSRSKTFASSPLLNMIYAIRPKQKDPEVIVYRYKGNLKDA